MRYIISHSSSAVSVVVSPKRSWTWLVLIPLWIVGWSWDSVRDTSSRPHSSSGTIILVLVSVFVAGAWLWEIAGREQLVFTATSLTQKRLLVGIAIHRRVFSTHKIEEPHFERWHRPKKWGRRGKRRTVSSIVFTYGDEKIGVGDYLSPRDAKKIIATVIQQLPELDRPWGSYKDGVTGFFPE